ncbi:Restriction endonuclease [compost metagenome]|jgi:hypothetical protein
MKAWKKYQENAAEHFRALGMTASTDSEVRGVRTNHDVDVLVTSHYAGFDITWIVECKHWKTPVNKLHVLALREIVADVGADRGILLSESGFQSGAIEAANLTNIQVTSLRDATLTAAPSIYAIRLNDLLNRTAICKDRYWEIPKRERIRHGLRPEVGQASYSAVQTMEMCSDLITRALRGNFPFRSDQLGALVKFGTKEFESALEVLVIVEPEITSLETKLNEYDSYQKQ